MSIITCTKKNRAQIYMISDIKQGSAQAGSAAVERDAAARGYIKRTACRAFEPRLEA